jgi:thiamine-monophosphate kinase
VSPFKEVIEMADPKILMLRDLGERRIVQDLIAPRFPLMGDLISGIGDDCAVIRCPEAGQVLVMTTDPCPTPVICLLETPDYYHYGRFTILINMSDLAAMGATPIGIVVSTVMSEDMSVGDYTRFLDGLADASREWDCPVIGGNIKDGPTFTANASALGSIKEDMVMRRLGAVAGDHVCVVGVMGLFWAAALGRISGISLDATQQRALDEALYTPVARIREGKMLARTKQVTACIDSSDGIAACLQELAVVNEVDVIVDSALLLPHVAVHRIADASGTDFRKLMLAWGGWELVCTVPKEALNEVHKSMEQLGTKFTVIGEVLPGSGRVWIKEGNLVGQLAKLGSERFSPTSTFTHGLEAYLNFLRSEPLTTV